MILVFLSLLTAGWAQTSASPAVKPKPAPVPAAKPAPVAVKPAPAPSAKPVATATAKPVPVSGNIEQGKRAYMAVCIQCHNKDPNKKGSLGPELVDSPLSIMEYKVANGAYPATLPPGFVPKRKTKAMRKLPNSVKDVSHIHAWIQSVKAKK